MRSDIGRRGAALFLTFIMLFFTVALGVALATFAQHSQAASRSAMLDNQAYYIAEAGWQRARQALTAGTWTAAASPGNTYTESFGAGEYRVTIVDEGSNVYTITSEGYVPSQLNTAAKRQIVEYEIDVTASSGTNHALTATASASTSASGHAASAANDGSASTHWQANTAGNGQWLKLDLGASPATINQIIIEENNNIEDDGVALAWSDDNSAWTTFASGSAIIESPNKTWTANFTAFAHRYVRATLTATGSSKKVSIEECKAYNASLSSLSQGEVATQW